MKLQFLIITVFSTIVALKASGMDHAGLSESGSSSGEVKATIVVAALKNPSIVRTKSSDIDPANTAKLDTEMVAALAQMAKKSSPRGNNSPRDGRPRTSSLSHCSNQSDKPAVPVELP